VTVVAVLAGGASRRMGSPKPLAELGGVPLLVHPMQAVLATGLPAVIVAKAWMHLPAFGVPVWMEPDEPFHPLTGIVAALERAGEPVVAVACDQPWLEPEVITRLAGADGTAAYTVHGRLEPFPARYEPTSLGALRDALVVEASMRRTLESLAPTILGEVDPEVVAGINSPEALAEARRRLGSRP
jgi:molybdopterin-guanine dinucleotide biosynthesis protein A